MLPKISILIANYNNGRFFKDCYKSLSNQTESRWEAIIIDDGSTDNSVGIISDLIRNDSRFLFYQNSINIGYQRALMRAISLAHAKIFGRLDPDDALAPSAIEYSLKAHSENSEVGLVYSNFTICDELLQPIVTHKATQIKELQESYYNFNSEISHFATFKKEVYNKTSGIDPFIKRAEDKDIYMKMCEIAPVKYIDEDLYLYRVHDGGVSSPLNSEKALFWHWVALIKMAERRNINLEDLFVEKFVARQKLEDKNYVLALLKKSRWLKLGHRLGLFKGYDYF